jgi:hypothetical protein
MPPRYWRTVLSPHYYLMGKGPVQVGIYYSTDVYIVAEKEIMVNKSKSNE